jgi:sterol desaturase/sphingolipid hydroxylase (fatty acid hydroxylase superfamily)
MSGVNLDQKSVVNHIKDKLGLLAKTSPFIIIPLDLAIIFFFLIVGFSERPVFEIEPWVWFLSGLTFWSLLEYLMHRFAFHYQAKGKVGKTLVYGLHLIHHDHPTDEDKLFQPPLVNLLMIFVLFMGLSTILGEFALFFMPGLILGYIAYSSLHYSIHRFNPPFKFLRPIWRHHNLHHYRFPDKAFGVSSPLWDFIFGTLPPKNLGE